MRDQYITNFCLIKSRAKNNRTMNNIITRVRIDFQIKNLIVSERYFNG